MGRMVACAGVLLGAGGGFTGAHSAETPEPASVEAGVTDVPPSADRLRVLELFSSEICMFCSEAEAFLNSELSKDSVLGLTCMVDYMQTQRDGPGRAVCSARQMDYALKLGTGPVYTPQIVLNGAADAVGHRPPSVEEALRIVEEKKAYPVRLVLQPEEAGGFSVSLPSLVPSTGSASSFSMTAALYRQTEQLPVRSGEARTVRHAVFEIKTLEPWDGRSGTMRLKAVLRPGQGIALIVQDPASGAIVAAGSAEALSDSPSSKPSGQ